MSFKNQHGAISACFILLASLLLLTGCGKNNQKILNNLNARPYDKVQEKEGVCVGIKDLSNKEAKAIFSKTNKNITHKYKVLQLNIENDSTSKYEINKNSFETKIETLKSVYDYMKTKTFIKTVLSSTVLSTAMLPISLLTSAFIVDLMYAGTYAGPSVTGMVGLFFVLPIVCITIFAINNIIFGKRYIRHNKQTLEAIHNHILDLEKENIIFPNRDLPNQNLNKLVFIDKKNWKEKLNLILFDIDTLRFLNFEI